MLRDALSAEVKREVRQKCRFGCVICRSPIYGYEHFHEYATVKEHTAENIFLICPNCHRNKGRLYNKNLIKEKVALLSSTNSVSYGEYIRFDSPLVDLGSNIISSYPAPDVFHFKIFDKAFIRVNIVDGVPLLSAFFKNTKNRVTLEIVDSEIKVYSNVWDIKFEAGVLEVRNAPRQILWKIAFLGNENIIKIRGYILIDDKRKIFIKDNGVFCGKTLIAKNCVFSMQEKFGIEFIDKPTTNYGYVLGKDWCLRNISGLSLCGISGGKGGLLLDYEYLKKIHDFGTDHELHCICIFGRI